MIEDRSIGREAGKGCEIRGITVALLTQDCRNAANVVTTAATTNSGAHDR
jgi:hypothetical protein